MKKIYKITLDEDIPLSDKDKVIDDIKLICYLTYSYIRDLSDDNDILYTKNIRFNELLEKKHGDSSYTHRFESNKIDGSVEPFMIGDTSFCFTVDDGMISEKDVYNGIASAYMYMHTNGHRYKFNVTSLSYLEDDKGRNRLLAIRKLVTSQQKIINQSKGRSRTLSMIPMLHTVRR